MKTRAERLGELRETLSFDRKRSLKLADTRVEGSKRNIAFRSFKYGFDQGVLAADANPSEQVEKLVMALEYYSSKNKIKYFIDGAINEAIADDALATFKQKGE